jgi:hypothetical protein
MFLGRLTMRYWLALAAIIAGCGGPIAATFQNPGKVAVRAKADLPQPPTEWIPSPNFNDRPASDAIDTVVWHHTAGRSDARATARYFQNPASQVSSHYIVDRTGYIVRCVPDAKRSWHAGRSAFEGKPNVNHYSIGIEISNVGDNVDPYPNAQVESIIRLTAWLCKTYDIPVSRITRHRDVAIPHGRKNDTSDNYPLAYATKGVKALLAGEELPPRTEPQVPPGYNPRTKTYVVRPGDTWAEIADGELDNPLRADEIRALNPQVKRLKAGVQLQLPTDYELFFKLHGT